jgi:hypothetical protein
LRRVGQVEGFGAELNLQAFIDGKVLGDRDIGILLASGA